MILLDQPLRILENGLFAVHDGVGGQAALGLAERHRAARGLDAQPDLPGGGDLIVQFGAVGEEVQMVGGGGASREGQLGQSRLGGGEDILRLQAGPDGVERGQPVEEIGVLGGRDSTGQGLVEMVMCIDQPRQDDVIRQIEHFVGSLGQLTCRAHLLDKAVPNKKTTVGKLPLVVIHSKDIGVFDEKCGHEC